MLIIFSSLGILTENIYFTEYVRYKRYKLSSYSVLRKVLKKLWIKKNSTPPKLS